MSPFRLAVRLNSITVEHELLSQHYHCCLRVLDGPSKNNRKNSISCVNLVCPEAWRALLTREWHPLCLLYHLVRNRRSVPICITKCSRKLGPPLLHVARPRWESAKKKMCLKPWPSMWIYAAGKSDTSDDLGIVVACIMWVIMILMILSSTVVQLAGLGIFTASTVF